MSCLRVVLGLPGRIEELGSDPDRQYPTEEGRMPLAIEPSRKNGARDACRDNEAEAVLKEYAERGGTSYNARQGE